MVVGLEEVGRVAECTWTSRAVIATGLAQVTGHVSVADVPRARTRGVACRASTVTVHRREWSRGVSNAPVFAGSPPRARFGGCPVPPLVTTVVSAVIAWIKSTAARVESPLGTVLALPSDREFDSRLDEPSKMFPSQQSMSEGNRRGNTVGEQGHRARCSPSRSPGFARIRVDAKAPHCATAPANFNQRCELLNTCRGRRSVPPDKGDWRWRDGQSQYRGVSDHAIWPLGMPGPRPRRWSLTPRCLCLSRSGSSSDARVRAASKACGSPS